MSNVFGSNNSYNLNVQNNITAGGTISATTVQATNGNFTNLTGTVTPGQLIVQHVETTNDNASLIVGNNLSTLTNDSRGVHVGYNSLLGSSSIYGCTNSNSTGELYLNMPDSLPHAGVHIEKLYTQGITEQTPLAGVKIMDTITFGTNTITNNDSLTIAANGVTNNTLHLQSLGVEGITITPSSVTLNKPINTGNNSITMVNGSIATINGSININGTLFQNIGTTIGSTEYKTTNAKINNGIQDTLHISTATTGSLGWIAGSFGGPDAGPKPRVVMGSLDIGLGAKATIGGHTYNGSAYTAWDDLNINDSGNVHINSNLYSSANNLTVGGVVDVQNAYKVNNVQVLAKDSLLLQHTTLNPILVLTDDSTNINNMPTIGDYSGNGLSWGLYNGKRSLFGTTVAGTVGPFAAAGDVYLNETAGNICVGPAVSFTSPTKFNVNGNTTVQGDVNISGSFKVNGSAISGAGSKVMYCNNNFVGINVTTYFDANVICWNGVLSGIPTSMAMSVEGLGVDCTIQYRLMNFDRSITYFESPLTALVNGIQRVFSSNVITPMNGSTPTGPLILQIRKVSGANTFSYFGGSIVMT
jgi:hypothetical protein